MLVITNCLSEKADEGCIKVAGSLVKRIKKAREDVMVLTYERDSALSNLHLPLNKFLLSRRLFSVVARHRDGVLYIPFPARPIATAIRIFVLSCACRGRLRVALAMQCDADRISRFLLKVSGAEFVAFSADSARLYAAMVSEERVRYLKTGVDIQRFTPVSSAQKAALREKYHLPADKPVVLHVGHLKEGRNVGKLLCLGDKYQIVLVVSTLTSNEQDADLKDKLSACSNVRIIEEYLPAVQEIYQAADVYFFPTVAQGNCIDVPLSCMEAAACDLPVVTTDYGEMKQFLHRDGFYSIESFDPAALNALIDRAVQTCPANTREAVLEYDWNNAVSHLMNL